VSPTPDQVADSIGSWCCARLGCDRIGPDQNLFEIGLASLEIYGIIDLIWSMYGVPLTWNRLLDGPTIGGLTDFIVRTSGQHG
jgi:Phosphopantetheine attachment site